MVCYSNRNFGFVRFSTDLISIVCRKEETGVGSGGTPVQNTIIIMACK